MQERFARTKALLGEDAIEKLKKSTVAIFGVGGVGGACVEALARGGVGHLVLVDFDTISESNINRQIIALTSNIGEKKVEALKKRAEDINPEIKVTTCDCFFLPETQEEFDFSAYDYVIDAVDTVSAKLEIITRARIKGTKVISAMGAGNKLDPTAFKVAYIEDTKVCPLAKVMRYELKKRAINKVKCVYSEEKTTRGENENTEEKVIGSVSFVPPVMGYILAGEVIKDLTIR